MGVESMKEYVGIALRGCQTSASKHPLLTFMILLLIWIYRSCPAIFALLIDASPVIASTTVLLGTLLFFGHSNAPEIQQEEKPHHEFHNLKFGVIRDTEIDSRGVRREGRKKASRKKNSVVKRVNVNDNHHIVETDKLGSSIDKKFIQEATSGVGNQKEKIDLVTRCVHCQPLEDDKGWETGSEVAETSSPPASIPDIIQMVDEVHQLHDHPEVPHHAHVSNISTDAESGNAEDNNQGDIQVKDDEKEEEKEDDQKNLMNPSDSNENIIGRSPSEKSDPVDSVPLKPDTQFSNNNESFEVGPSTLMASNQGKEGYNLGPHLVPESETPNTTNYSSMHREMDEVSDSNMSSTPDKESVSSPLTENDHTREADLTSIKRDFHTESVSSSHYEDDPSGEADLHSVKEDYDEDDSTSIKKGFYAESVASSHYEDYPSQEADLISVKDGVYAESVGSSRYEDYPSREDESNSVKEGYDEDDFTSFKGDHYAESVASAYNEDDPSREGDTNSVKEGYYASEISDYVSQRSGSDDDDDTVKFSHDGRPDEVKTNGGGETGYQGNSRRESSSSPFADVNDHDDDEEEDYRSVIMPLTSHSEDQKIQEQGKETSQNSNSASTAEAVDSSVHDFESNSDHKQDNQSPKSEHDDSDSSVHDPESDSPVSKPNELGLPQRFSQVQQGLTSWFKWKA